MSEPLAAARAWVEAGRRVAVATVVSTWGSAPRRVGAVMCVDAEGAFEGSVSGGCVETAVVEAAGEAIATGEPRLLEFGVTNDLAWEVGLACGGSIEVWVDPTHTPARIARMAEARARGGSGVLTVDLGTGASAWHAGDRDIGRPGRRFGTVTDTAEATDTSEVQGLAPHVQQAFASGRSRVVEVDGSRVFLHALVPPWRVIIVGAVHIAQALAPMVSAAGYDVVVVDPRGVFATEARFPQVQIVRAWPDAAFEDLGIDARTAVVALTHDPKFDDPALSAALSGGAGYVGALGSRRTHARRVERLRASGLTEEQISRIRAPVGLDLGGRAPGEIAAAILAEIVRDAAGNGPKPNTRSE